MADNKTIFHGSNVVVERPQIIVSGYYKDFGFGFYCTNIEKQAKKWALTKKGDSFVSCTQKSLESITFEKSYSL